MRRQTARPPWETGRATGQGPAWRPSLDNRHVRGAGQPLCADHSPEFLERNRRAVPLRGRATMSLRRVGTNTEPGNSGIRYTVTGISMSI